MSGIFSKPNIPAPPPPPPPPPPVPTVDDARLAAETRDQMLKRRGRRTTILTGPEGAATPTTGKTTLLGS